MTTLKMKTLCGHEDRVTKIGSVPGSSLLVSGSLDGTVRLWDVQTCSQVVLLSEFNLRKVQSVAVSQDGQLIAYGCQNGKVHLRSLANIRRPNAFTAHKEWFNDVAFSEDGDLIATVSLGEGLRIWETKTFSEIQSVEISSFEVTFLPGGKQVLAGPGDLSIIEVATGKEISRLPGIPANEGFLVPVMSLDVSQDGNSIVIGCADGTVRIFDLPNGSEKQRFVLDVQVRSVKCSAEGEAVFVGGLEGVQLWSMLARKVVWSFSCPKVTSVSIPWDGRCLAAGLADGTVCLWEFQSHPLSPARDTIRTLWKTRKTTGVMPALIRSSGLRAGSRRIRRSGCKPLQ